MPHLPGVVSAGGPEATRLAQALIHRGAEAVAVAVAGERADRIRAARLPEVTESRRVADQRERERRRREGGHAPPDGREPGGEGDGPAGGLVDLQA